MKAQAIADVITRNNVVAFHAAFEDEDGNPTTVESATVRVSYLVNGVKTNADIAMETDTCGYVARWDSKVADPGTAYYHIEGKTGVTRAAIDGTLVLRANDANPQGGVIP